VHRLQREQLLAGSRTQCDPIGDGVTDQVVCAPRSAAPVPAARFLSVTVHAGIPAPPLPPADTPHLPYEFLDLVSRRIVNEVKGISRVVYDISGKPPATIEWE
jgi:hypothetical protein